MQSDRDARVFQPSPAQEPVFMPYNGGFPCLIGSMGEHFMGQTQESFYLGQFVLDRSHRVTAWDGAMENFSGILAGNIVGTNDHWRFLS